MYIEDVKLMLDFPEICDLYNKWYNVTQLLSTGNCKVKQWDDLVNYCKEHKQDFAGFGYEYLELYGSNWIICALIDTIIGCPVIANEGQYINPNLEFVKTIYMVVCVAEATGKLTIDENGVMYINDYIENGNMRITWNTTKQ